MCELYDHTAAVERLLALHAIDLVEEPEGQRMGLWYLPDPLPGPVWIENVPWYMSDFAGIARRAGRGLFGRIPVDPSDSDC